MEENTWKTGSLISLLADLSGLLHDLGKSTKAFQDRLQGKTTEKNIIRHEWASLRLWESFVGEDNDKEWLVRLADFTEENQSRWLKNLQKDGITEKPTKPLKTFQNAPLARVIGWLIVSHHRLARIKDRKEITFSVLRGVLNRVDSTWNEPNFSNADKKDFLDQWSFPHGLPTQSKSWQKRVARIANKLSLIIADSDTIAEALNDPFVWHSGRLCLMLADHQYSRLHGNDPARSCGDSGFPLYANTTKGGEWNQPLDEHLIGVGTRGSLLANELPRLKEELPYVINKNLKKRSTVEKFQWQDTAADIACQYNKKSGGVFVVNMASTGFGKTLANAKIMNALSDPQKGLRCTFALGLRTLTHQTAKAFQSLLNLSDRDITLMVGGLDPHILQEKIEDEAESTGSASQQSIVEESTKLFSSESGGDDIPVFFQDHDVQRIIQAPLLVCTIDHMTPATEGYRAGKQIAPLLRLLTSDLVLDEPDDFDLDDLPALTRLVYFAGMFGSKILLSSATLPPAFVEGLFGAYRAGYTYWKKNTAIEEHEKAAKDSSTGSVICMWVDEFQQKMDSCDDRQSFENSHAEFVRKRKEHLESKPGKTKAEIVSMQVSLPKKNDEDMESIAVSWVPILQNSAIELHHRYHQVDTKTKKTVSFGIIRMANIQPIVEVAKQWFKYGDNIPDNTNIHLCVYHSQHPLLTRSAIEHTLDTVLFRKNPDDIFSHPEIKKVLQESAAEHHLFIVLASPVAEVGRDHDYDWAIIEPSSMRSIIQTSGRVLRHRNREVSAPNIKLLEYNFRHYRNELNKDKRDKDPRCFYWPGFEKKLDSGFQCNTHSLHQLVRPEEIENVNSIPRIFVADKNTLQPTEKLGDLEQSRLQDWMLGVSGRINASTIWMENPIDTTTTGILQYKDPFRSDRYSNDITLLLSPEDDIIQELQKEKSPVSIEQEKIIRITSVQEKERIKFWATPDYQEYQDSMKNISEKLGMTIEKCAEIFGTVSVKASDSGWRFHHKMGFSKAV